MIQPNIPLRSIYDVIICGGGLAGQTLARQLLRNYPDLSIVILEKSTFPLPAAACKVGESTVEVAGHYFSTALSLKDYFKNNHLTKLGLRYYFGDSQGCLSARPELGLSAFPAYDSFQIDRGIFENDLCEMNRLNGVKVEEGVKVREIRLHESDGPHVVEYEETASGTVRTLQGGWVIDAMGRRCFLQRRLGLTVKPATNNSAAWFRIKGRIDVDDFVPGENREWHQRMPHRIRFYSTTHLMGHGYWVWLIPLISGSTSVGIVTAEAIHPISTYSSQEKAMAWLEKHEPVVFRHIQDATFLDFLTLKNYAYSSRQVFSADRWACVGEAGVFSDPFYSPGSNMIGFGNTMVTAMIGLDRQRALTRDKVTQFNNFALSYQEWLLQSIHPSYTYFGDPQIMSLNYLWDLVVGWSVTVPQMFHSIYLHDTLSTEVRKITAAYFALAIRIKQLFKDWEKCVRGSFSFKFLDYLAVPFIREIYDRNVLPAEKSDEELLADHRLNIARIEAFAIVIFLLAVQDSMPAALERLPFPGQLNPQGISLDPNAWEQDGLFDQDKPLVHFPAIYAEISQLYYSTQSTTTDIPVALAVDFNFDFNK